MADKSPRQAASKKSGKSIKEKRADKRDRRSPPSSLDKATSSKPASPKEVSGSMNHLTLGVLATTRKPDERRLPIHPLHLDRIAPELGSR